MIKFISLFVLAFGFLTFGQSNDSLLIKQDSLKTDSTTVSVLTDSSSAADSLLIQKVVPDTLVPQHIRPLSEVSTIIDKKTFLYYNYRYTGDLTRTFSLNFIKDFGFVGYPNETFLYGIGNGGISYLEDGVFWNSRLNNRFDLNHINSEDIDSIEIVRSPRGFLYSPVNNPVAVNFITQDFLSPIPYSRIKFYQGPYGEAMVDGKFNAKIFRRWNLSFQLQNRRGDDRYRNTAHSIWQANIKLKYFLSNKFNISAQYSFVSSEVGLNGGLAIDNAEQLAGDVNLTAPVVYPNRIKNVVNHNFGLRFLAKPFGNAKADLTVYYKLAFDSTKNRIDTLRTEFDTDEKTYGAVLRYDQKFGLLSMQVIGTYENSSDSVMNLWAPDSLPAVLLNTYSEVKLYSLSAVAGLNLFGGKVVPAVFYKYTNRTNDFFINYNGLLLNANDKGGFSGVGADVKINLSDSLSFYAGYSIFSKKNQLDFGKSDIKTFEAGGRFISPFLLADIKYFTRSGSNVMPTDAVLNPPVVFGNLSGIGANINLRLWRLLLETNSSYYFNSGNEMLVGVPEYQFVGGLYLTGYYFKNNLNLKAGFVFTLTGWTNTYSETNLGIVSAKPSNKLDLSVAGEIQEVAIVYFIWENLFGYQYFITPFYPMPERSIRFGVSWILFN